MDNENRVKAINQKLKAYNMRLHKERGEERYTIVRTDLNAVYSAYGDKLTLEEVEELVNDKTIFS